MATISVAVDENVKRDADALFKSLGLTMSTAVNIFLKKALVEGGIPFRVGMRERGVYVDPSRVCVPRRSADGTAVLPADWDDPEDAVYDGVYA